MVVQIFHRIHVEMGWRGNLLTPARLLTPFPDEARGLEASITPL